MSEAVTYDRIIVRTCEAKTFEVGPGAELTYPESTYVLGGEYADETPDLMIEVHVARDEEGNDRSQQVAAVIAAALSVPMSA